MPLLNRPNTFSKQNNFLDDVAVGGTSSSAPFFFDVSAKQLSIDAGFRMLRESNIAKFKAGGAGSKFEFLCTALMNADTRLNIQGNGTGAGILQCNNIDAIEWNATRSILTLLAQEQGDVSFFGGEDNKEVRIQGQITAAAAAKYGYLQVEDTNDEFVLGLEDANVLGTTIKLSDAAGATEFRVRDSNNAEVHAIDSDGNVTMADAANIVLNTTTGTKIGTAAGQKLGFFGATPVAQQAHVADGAGQDLAGSDTVDEAKVESDITDLWTTVNGLLALVRTFGLRAAA